MSETPSSCSYFDKDRCAEPATHIAYHRNGWPPSRVLCEAHSRALLRDHLRLHRIEPLVCNELVVAIVCGAFCGWLDDTLSALVCGDDESRRVALDLAEQRGLHAGGWTPREVEWPRVERHEHVWFEVDSGQPQVEGFKPPRRCTCGKNEHGDTLMF